MSKLKAYVLALVTLLVTGGLIFIAHQHISTVQAQNQGQGAPEVIKHKTNPHGADSLTTGSTGQQTPVIAYNGGQLIATPAAYIIWYGNWKQANAQDDGMAQEVIRDFLANVHGSPYFNINTTYSAGGTNITGGLTFTRGAAGQNGAFEKDDNYSAGSRLRDSSILSIVNRAINNGLPRDENGVYFVLTSSDVTETSGFCTKYCGWHTSATSTLTSNGKLRYSFVGNAARCLNACAAQTNSPNGRSGADAMVSIIAHELEEATTDPDPRSGWADSGGSENADKCAWTFGSGQYPAANNSFANVRLGSRDFLIQRNLDASNSKCYMALGGQQ